MRGCLIVALIVVAVAVVFGGCGVQQYNSLVERQEAVDMQWSEIKNQYQRRADLIPQLVETVKGARDFEQETLTAVIEQRRQVVQMQVPESVTDDPEAAERWLAAQQQLGSALSRLLAVSERYPELKAIAGFQTLQAQIEGTENRIAVARRDYLDTARQYNAATRRVPTNLIANLFGFDRAPEIEFREGIDQPPTIDFGK